MKEYFKNQRKLESFVDSELKTENTGHNSEHIKRVLSLALKISTKEEKINYKVLIASCFLHDISLSNGSIHGHEIESAKLAKNILKKYSFSDEEINQVYNIILNHNRGFGVKKILIDDLPIEAKILCDADRLDSLGSIGIVRMIQFSTKQNIPLTTKYNKLDESVYGNLSYLRNLGDDLLTSEGKKLARLKTKKITSFLNDLDSELNIFQ